MQILHVVTEKVGGNHDKVKEDHLPGCKSSGRIPVELVR